MFDNLLLLTDSYKVSHFLQYPPRTERVFSFFESRGGEFPETVFFGLQYFLKRYLSGQVVSKDKIVEADAFFLKHFGQPLFNRAGWEYILEKYNGFLPIRIKAVPEGMRVPSRNVLMTVENLDPSCFWLINYLETLLVQVWYPTTVATQSYFMKQTLLESLEATGDPSLIDFKLHDFGFRGSTSVESAGLGGAAHLVNFLGTDTVPGLILAREIYQEEMAGFSIPAAEHSTITSWGKGNETEAFANMLQQYPSGLVAVVSDSYDIFHACRKIWGQYLRAQVLDRDGVLIVRPDSGDPPSVVVKVLQALGDSFGISHNSKGFKLLNPKVRVIQGDGIDPIMLKKILLTTQGEGWSTDNIAFGSGGGLLQKVNRDTCKFAFKCSAILQGGVWKDVMKDPVTDPGKTSKAGRLILMKENYGFTTMKDFEGSDSSNLLQSVFESGKILIDQNFSDIRQRVKGV